MKHMSHLQKIVFAALVVIEIALRNGIVKMSTWHDRVTSSLLDRLFYRGGPGEVTVGMIDDMRVVGHVYIRDWDRTIQRLPFNVQNLPSTERWDVNYTRSLATAIMGYGFNVVWIERNNEITSPTSGLWSPIVGEYARIVNLHK